MKAFDYRQGTYADIHLLDRLNEGIWSIDPMRHRRAGYQSYCEHL